MAASTSWSASHIWRKWEQEVLDSGLPLYVDPEHDGLVRFAHATGGDPPTAFTVVHWPSRRPGILETETRRRSRRLSTDLFDEVGPRCDPLALSRRRDVVVKVDGVDFVAPVAQLDGRFVMAVELVDHDLVVRGRARDASGLVLERVEVTTLF